MQNALPSIARGGASPLRTPSRIAHNGSDRVVRGTESLCSPASVAGEPETPGSDYPFTPLSAAGANANHLPAIRSRSSPSYRGSRHRRGDSAVGIARRDRL